MCYLKPSIVELHSLLLLLLLPLLLLIMEYAKLLLEAIEIKVVLGKYVKCKTNTFLHSSKKFSFSHFFFFRFFFLVILFRGTNGTIFYDLLPFFFVYWFLDLKKQLVPFSVLLFLSCFLFFFVFFFFFFFFFPKTLTAFICETYCLVIIRLYKKMQTIQLIKKIKKEDVIVSSSTPQYCVFYFSTVCVFYCFCGCFSTN